MNEVKQPTIEKEIGKQVKKAEGKLIRLKLKEIVLYKRNAKIHTESQIAKIRESIIKFGYKDPIAVDENNLILEGHGRLLALYQIDTTGDKEVSVLQITDLTESEKKAYRIAHNKLNMETGFDVEILKEEFYELEDTDNFNDTGFETNEITEMWDSDKEIVEDKVDVNAYERAKSKTKIKQGEIYLLGNHRLMCGDSTESQQVDKLMNGKKADMVFTDPPYNINMSPASVARDLLKLDNDNLSDEDFETFLLKALKCQKDNCKGEMFICCDWRKYHIFKKCVEECGDEVKNLIVWNKMKLAQNLNKIAFVHEFIIYTGYMGTPTKDINVWDCKREYSSEHLTPKPLELISRALKLSSNSGDIVLDLFGGSGSTLIACEQLERKCYMSEIDPVYCQVIIDRWEKFTNKEAIKE